MKFLKVSYVEFQENLVKDSWDACKTPFVTLWKLGFIRVNLAQPNFPATSDKKFCLYSFNKMRELLMENMDPPPPDPFWSYMN
jgi:hypothetical protein